MKKILVAILMGFSSMTAFSQKAKFDLNVAKKEIQLQINAFVDALSKSDTIALGNLYTIDAKILNNGSPSTIGRPAIIKDYGETVRSGMTVFNSTITGLWGDNNLLVEESTGYFAYTNGKVAGKGIFLLVWKKEKGEWKIFRDTYFADVKPSK